MFFWNRLFGSATITALLTNFATLNSMCGDGHELQSRVNFPFHKYSLKRLIRATPPLNTQILITLIKKNSIFPPIYCKTIQTFHFVGLVYLSAPQQKAGNTMQITAQCNLMPNEHVACMNLHRVHASRGTLIGQVTAGKS